MKRFIPGIALLVGALAISGQASAHGGGWYGPGPVIGAAVVGAVVGAAVSGGHDRTVYVERQPAYYPPPPVYVQAPPPPVYYQPYVVERYVPAPPPVYYGPPRW
ncbi:hypothetical protein QVM48_10765 [Pseudomonas soli]|jgi:hypothetical protein|uniref:PXPV repeat-containing protein n=1 Tax=Pseudomonas soli TaxID=1306993 RepID=A0A1H9RC73_9PSED|nr:MULTISPECIES: hypothetical protein [Pseudomonas]AUY32230.1 hypothetical protein C3F42_02900 [Pseudomonas sp. PONIH3]MDT3715569.1 hypothetical protein [Pseudomonas soli]MDT3732472.1 hypothetical protein [Pseudomonas soli]MEE1881439.1 hypothetical protein [Pseudomonas soli]SER70346.1 hypothetical protein SAMN05216230_1119 [Pseudomonas soli]